MLSFDFQFTFTLNRFSICGVNSSCFMKDNPICDAGLDRTEPVSCNSRNTIRDHDAPTTLFCRSQSTAIVTLICRKHLGRRQSMTAAARMQPPFSRKLRRICDLGLAVCTTFLQQWLPARHWFLLVCRTFRDHKLRRSIGYVKGPCLQTSRGSF